MTYLEMAEGYAENWLQWSAWDQWDDTKVIGLTEPPMPDMERIWALYQFARAPMVARMKMRKAGVTNTMTQHMNWMAGINP